MSHKVSELSSEQRIVLEALIGRTLRNDESLVVRPCQMIKSAPLDKEREKAAREYSAHLDFLSARGKAVPEDELDNLIEEACDRVRHAPE